MKDLSVKLLAGLAWAATTTGSGIDEPQDIVDILNNLVNWVFYIFLVVAVIFIFYSAFLFLTAGGDTEKISKAKSQLIWSIVAIAVALVATGARFIVEDILNAK